MKNAYKVYCNSSVTHEMFGNQRQRSLHNPLVQIWYKGTLFT